MPSFVSESDKIDHTPTGAVAAGAMVVIGNLVTMADRPIAANERGAVIVHGIVTGAVHTTGTAWQAGTGVRWYAPSGVFDLTTGVTAGYVAAPKAATELVATVLLWPGA